MKAVKPAACRRAASVMKTQPVKTALGTRRCQKRKPQQIEPATPLQLQQEPLMRPRVQLLLQPSSASGATYEVQLGSYRETADAKKDWSRFQKKYAEYLGKLKMRLVKADITGKGTYYRLRAGTVSKDRAHAICDALKADHGVGCILAKR